MMRLSKLEVKMSIADGVNRSNWIFQRLTLVNHLPIWLFISFIPFVFSSSQLG